MTAPIETNELMIRRLRKCLKSCRNDFLLKNLPDLHLIGLYQQIRAGNSLSECAKWLKERGHLRDSSYDSARKLVQKFKGKIAPLLIPNPPAPDKKLPPALPTIKTGDLEKISELVDLYAQALRTELLIAVEGGPLNSNCAKHAGGLSALVKTKQDLLSKQPKKSEVDKATSEKLGKMIQALPDRGERLAKLASALVEEMEADAIECETDENGNFIEIGKPA